MKPQLPYRFNEWPKEKQVAFLLNRIDYYLSSVKDADSVRFKSSMLTYADHYAQIYKDYAV